MLRTVNDNDQVIILVYIRNCSCVSAFSSAHPKIHSWKMEHNMNMAWVRE